MTEQRPSKVGTNLPPSRNGSGGLKINLGADGKKTKRPQWGKIKVLAATYQPSLMVFSVEKKTVVTYQPSLMRPYMNLIALFI